MLFSVVSVVRGAIFVAIDDGCVFVVVVTTEVPILVDICVVSFVVVAVCVVFISMVTGVLLEGSVGDSVGF